jgi:hypothetical protein
MYRLGPGWKPGLLIRIRIILGCWIRVWIWDESGPRGAVNAYNADMKAQNEALEGL